MKLSEIKNEEALDVLAEIIEPVTKILADPEIKNVIKDKNRLMIAKYVLKNHKKSVIQIMAALDRVPEDKYECNIITLPLKLLELLNDDGLISFFTSQALMADQTSFTGVTENIKETEEA